MACEGKFEVIYLFFDMITIKRNVVKIGNKNCSI